MMSWKLRETDVPKMEWKGLVFVPVPFWRAGGGRRKFRGSAEEIAAKCASVVRFVKGRREDQENEMSMMLEALAK